jgi:hypothetical protein
LDSELLWGAEGRSQADQHGELLFPVIPQSRACDRPLSKRQSCRKPTTAEVEGAHTGLLWAVCRDLWEHCISAPFSVKQNLL